MFKRLYERFVVKSKPEELSPKQLTPLETFDKLNQVNLELRSRLRNNPIPQTKLTSSYIVPDKNLVDLNERLLELIRYHRNKQVFTSVLLSTNQNEVSLNDLTVTSDGYYLPINESLIELTETIERYAQLLIENRDEINGLCSRNRSISYIFAKELTTFIEQLIHT